MYTLVLTRHGQSEWNLKNFFTGWTDVRLTEQGIQEARNAGKKLKTAGYKFDIAYTSVLTRAIHTLDLILDEMDFAYLPVKKNWRLNERHYGSLQGLNKTETVQKFGQEQVHKWRRSYDILPPELEITDPRHPKNDSRYKNLPDSYLPNTENLKLTVARVLPYWQVEIVPQLIAGKKILISAHGNSLRALIKHLENISDEEIPKLEIATGQPIAYKLDQNLKVVSKKEL